MAKNDGGSAFPHEPGEFSSRPATYGMSLRDWFAGQVVTGLLSDMPAVSEASREAGKDGSAYIAEAAYEVADAMLAARAAS